MKQIKITPDKNITLEFSDVVENKLYNLLKPVVFEDDKLFCCCLGPDVRIGIKGFGHTPQEAIEDWEISLKQRIKQPFNNDELARSVIAILTTSDRYAPAN